VVLFTTLGTDTWKRHKGGAGNNQMFSHNAGKSLMPNCFDSRLYRERLRDQFSSD